MTYDPDDPRVQRDAEKFYRETRRKERESTVTIDGRELFPEEAKRLEEIAEAVHLPVTKVTEVLELERVTGFQNGLAPWADLDSRCISLSTEASDCLARLLDYVIESAETQCYCRDCEIDFDNNEPNPVVRDRCARCLALTVDLSIDRENVGGR